MNLTRMRSLAYLAPLYAALCLAPPSSLAQTSVEIPAAKVEKSTAILEHIEHLKGYIRDRAETQKAERAMQAERAKIPPGETRMYEIVTTGGPLMSGGKFVRVQEVKAGESSAKISAAGEQVNKPFPVGGGLPLPTEKLTPEQKQEMQRRVDEYKKREKLLKEAEDAQKRMREIQEAAEKAKIDLAKAKEAEAEAAQKAKIASDERVAAAKAAAAAAKAERDADRNGREITREIAKEREQFRRSGGPFRAPA